MHTLEDIYNRLDTGAAGAKRGGGFMEPAAGPGSTMHTLDEIMAIAPAADNSNGGKPLDTCLPVNGRRSPALGSLRRFHI